MSPLVRAFEEAPEMEVEVCVTAQHREMLDQVLAFKPNIDDLRESPATYIVQKVIQASGDEDYFITEPNIERHSIFKMTSYQDVFNQADVVAFLVAHREFKELSPSPEKVILDFAGIFAG